MEFYVSKYPTLSSVFPKGSSERVSVPTVALDELYRPAIPTVIKIDIEGSEYRAIRSASRFLKSHHASFFIELHSWGDKALGKYPIHACWLLLRNGYALRKVGTHYFFYRANRMSRNVSFLAAFPSLALKYLLRRFGGPIGPWLQRLRLRMQRP